MDPELEKKIKRVEPTKAESKRLYDQPLRVLRRGPDRKMFGIPEGIRQFQLTPASVDTQLGKLRTHSFT